MSTKNPGEKAKWRRRKSPKNPEDDNDCASLAWLLDFRLDEIVNVKVPDEEPAVKEPRSYVCERPAAPRKPPFTYPELIERALREKGELTVSALYQWISDRFPFYKANDERWKNSVRHNLSINPHFRKGARASQGAGHLWSLAANAIDLLPLRNHAYSNNYEITPDTYKEKYVPEGPKSRLETCWSIAANARDLMPLRNSHVYIDSNTGETIQEAHVIECPKVIVLDEAAIAAASIIPDNDLFSGSTMFLNPVSTEQVVRECGLITAD